VRDDLDGAAGDAKRQADRDDGDSAALGGPRVDVRAVAPGRPESPGVREPLLDVGGYEADRAVVGTEAYGGIRPSAAA
jgi:hypothetical protein